ncbi:MAG: hypothetical protein ISN26_01530 [Betaproteobacteria bacterium AqS2]|uniref:Phosphoribosylglycinamide synthetase N-terminal domain-containing protein n=1 Tax=Candidatus Amphirhobacter heronislandensis TaxID=1732024 RepID=A0A930XW67_9GAMM|nr:hypothetical protein [Betaproteobacteria bacterium AqS2]
MVVGQGGRENALAWKLAREEQVERVWVAPGNAGTAAAGAARLAANDIDSWLAQALEQAIGLTVVGPEQPLADGIADVFEEAGLAIVGPTAAAARIESSKIHAKELLDELGIATPAWVAVRQAADAEDFLARHEASPAARARRRRRTAPRRASWSRPGWPAGSVMRRASWCSRSSSPGRSGRWSRCATASMPWRCRWRGTTRACMTTAPARTPAAWARSVPLRSPAGRTRSSCARLRSPRSSRSCKSGGRRTAASCTPG